MDIGRRDGDLRLLGGEQRGLVTQRALERRQTRRGGDQGVVGVFHPRQVAAPMRCVLLAEAPKSVLQGLVGTFSLAVGLRVVPGGQADRGPNPSAKGLPHLGRELGTTVRDDVHRNTM